MTGIVLNPWQIMKNEINKLFNLMVFPLVMEITK